MHYRFCCCLELLLFLPLPILAVCDFSSLPIISVPIQNVSFSANGTSIPGTDTARGLNIPIGTPPQPMAWYPRADFNNTYISSDKGWKNTTSSTSQSMNQYAVLGGGFYIEGESLTWVEKEGLLEAGASEEVGDEFDGTWGTDTLHLNTTHDLDSFPINLFDSTPNALGLGRNSTFLNILKASTTIASRTWSVFWGLTGSDSEAQMDGVAVFGGYDRAKVTGQNITVPLTPNPNEACSSGLIVKLASLDIQFPDGESINIQSSPLDYCLTPWFAFLSLQLDTISSFLENAGGTWLGSPQHTTSSGAMSKEPVAQLYLASGIFDGSLNFTFEGSNGNLSIVVPNDQLVIPNYEVQSNGSTTFNESERVVLISDGSRDGINLLGMPLFTAAYLMVTHDTDPPLLTLWQSNNNAANDFAAVDADGTICTSSSFAGTISPQGTSNGSTPSAGSAPPAESIPSTKSNGLSSGGIAGIAVGATAVLSIIATTFLLLRKKQRALSSPSNGDTPSDPTPELQPRWLGYGGMSLKAELPAQT